jgi:hypothetical protein
VIKRIILLLIVAILGLSTPALAAEGGSGVVEGQLINGTESGGSVVDIDVTLKTYLDDVEVGSAITKTDAEGYFAFDGVSTEPDNIYEVKVVYQKAEYFSEWLSFGEGETEKFIEVTVYNATDSDEAIVVAMAHTVIYVGEDSLKVNEYYLLANESDLAYIGSEEIGDGVRQTLGFSLPVGATELQSNGGLMECCIYVSEDGFVDSMPFFPGMKEILYSYTIDNDSDTYAFSKRVNYPTLSYNFLVQGSDIAVSSEQLAPEEPLEVDGAQFTHLSGNNLVADDILLAQISGLPVASNSASIILWTILAIVVLGGGFAIIYSVRKRQPKPALVESNLEQVKQKLLTQLAQLDEDYESGKISEEIYNRQRTEAKSQLLNMMQNDKAKSGQS